MHVLDLVEGRNGDFREAINKLLEPSGEILPATGYWRCHYRFANRLAFAWKTASEGMPTILLYLGFTGDDGISDER
jgi:hypothetical protein